MADLTREPRPGPHLALETTEPMSVGHGFISGMVSAILGIAGIGLRHVLRETQAEDEAEAG